MKKNTSKLVSLLLYSIIFIINVIPLISVFMRLKYYRGISYLFIFFDVLCVLSIAILIGTTITAIKTGVSTTKFVKNGGFWIYAFCRIFPTLFSMILYRYFNFTSILYDIIYVSIVYISTFKLEKWIKSTNINTNSSSNKNSENDLIKEIYNIEEQIQKAQDEPSKKNNIVLSVISIIGCFGCLFACFIVMDYALGVSFVLIFIGIALLCISIWSGTRELFGNKSKQQAIQILQKQLDDLLVVDKQSVKFYIDCSEMIKNGDKITEVLSVIGQKYGYSNLSSAQAYYKKGEQEIKKQEVVDKYKKEQAKKDKLAETHKKEQSDASEESSKRYKTGKEKYLVELRKWIGLIESQKKVAENMRTISSCNANYRARTSDWAIAGGIGSALGGAGLGVASAIDTQVKNEREKEKAREKHALSRTQSSIAFDIEYEAKAEEKKALKYLQAMEEVLIDEQNINVKFKLLECSNICISLTKGNNLCVKFKLKCLAQPMILSKPAIFDGVLKLSIYSNENKIVSTGYYVANGYGNYNYQNAGFKMEENIKVICPIDSSVNLDDLRCEITPEALWFIEENKSVFRVNNSTISEAYESYKKTYNEQAKNVILNM